MRILLDCRPLLVAGADSERTQIFLAAAAGLSRDKGVEWVLAGDDALRSSGVELSLSGGVEIVVARAVPGRIGWKLWNDRTIPRLAKKYGVDRVLLPDKMEILVWPSRNVVVLSMEEREEVKREHAGGKEYFLADVGAAGEEGIVQLLKSFSLFKKRQRSNMQLILFSDGALSAVLKEKLDTYKYRQDVHWVEGRARWASLAGAAYALLFPFRPIGLGRLVLDAWQSEVPVIVGRDAGWPDWLGENVLYADVAGDAGLLAAQLMVIYKDEGMRRQLIEKGKAAVGGFSEERSLAALWAGIQ